MSCAGHVMRRTENRWTTIAKEWCRGSGRSREGQKTRWRVARRKPEGHERTWMARDRKEAPCQLGEKNSQKEASMFSQMNDDTNAWEAVSDKQVLGLVGRCAH